MHTDEELEQLLQMSLADKITMSKVRIVEFYEHYDGNVVVSFSGGKDSTVLLHLVRSLFSDVKGVYCDTGLEFPEVKEHVKSMENIDIIRPQLSFRQVIEQYGWVYPSKETAKKIYYAQKGRPWAQCHMAGNEKDGTPSKFKARYKRWQFLVDSPFKISHKCCDVMKKKPFHDYMKRHGGGMLVGTMTCESRLRKQAWLKTGCNAFQLGKGMPLSFWTEEDILQYILDEQLQIPTVYGDIVKVGDKLITTGEKRTGCMFCPIGVHLEKYPNRFQRMAKSHPEIYDYCIHKLGLGELLDYVGVDYRPHDEQLNLFEEVHPCSK